MIDTLIKHRAKANQSQVLSKIGVKEKSYGLITLHRPNNVDSRETFEGILGTLSEISQKIPIIFPCHPRTKERIKEFNLSHYINNEENDKPVKGIHLCPPLGYLDFLKLMGEAKVVLTDSGGIQEETTILGVPCLTLRENTERPITVTKGGNTIVGTDRRKIVAKALEVLNGHPPKSSTPELWDGKAAERIIQILGSIQNRK